MTHYRAATAAPRAHAREAKGADAPARRLRAALMSHHQGSMVSYRRAITVSGRDGGPARPCARSQGRGCARPASEGRLDVSASGLAGVIPASYNDDTLPVSGRDDGPARPCARSQGRGCARPASEGSLDESPSRLDGITGIGYRRRLKPDARTSGGRRSRSRDPPR